MLVFALLMSISIKTTYAAEKVNVNGESVIILVDNKDQKVAENTDGEFTYRSTYFKKTQMVTVSKTDNSTGEIAENYTFSLKPDPSLVEGDGIMAAAASTYQNTFCNYEYTKTYGTPNTWQIRRPKGGLNSWEYWNCTEKSSNASYLKDYLNTVNRIDALEWKWIGEFGTQSLLGLLGAIFSGGMTVFLASITAGTLAYTTASELRTQMNTALDLYWEIVYRS